MAKEKETLPPVVVVSGKHTYLRERFLRELASGMRQSYGHVASRVSGDNMGALDSATAGSTIVEGKVLLIIDDPELAMLPVLDAWHRHGDADEAVLVIHIQGSPPAAPGDEPKKGKPGKMTMARLVAELKKQHRTFVEIPVWQQDDHAANFLVEECKARGKVLDPGLALGIVKRIGADLGIVTHEALKACVLADAMGVDNLSAEVFRGSLAILAEATVQPLTTALVGGQVTDVSRALDLIQTTNKGDPTMRVCGTLVPQVIRAIAVADMFAKGVPEADAAARLSDVRSQNLYGFQLGTGKQARTWGAQGARALLQVLVAAQRGVLEGHVSAWVGLQAGLLGWAAGRGG